MGFKLSQWDEQLIQYAHLFEERLSGLNVNLSLEKALDMGWKILGECFKSHEVGIKESILNQFWPRECKHG